MLRFTATIYLEKNEIPKDKNRMILSFLKHHLEISDPGFYKRLYEPGGTEQKDLTFSLFMGECKFLRETIEVAEKEIFLNISTYDMGLGIQLYNALMKGKGEPYLYKGNTLILKKLQLQKEAVITGDEVAFQTMSPIVVREHREKDNSKTWFHSLNDPKGQQIFMENLKVQVINSFPEAKNDWNSLKLTVINNKEVKVKHYGIEVLGNIALFCMTGKPYLLDYMYKSGIGGLKSGGFGMLRIRQEVR